MPELRPPKIANESICEALPASRVAQSYPSYEMLQGLSMNYFH